MIRALLCFSLVALFAAVSHAEDATKPESDVPPSIARWKKEMDKFAAADAKSPVEPGGVVFVGSSSIRLWDLKKWYPERNAVNRGFGGSKLEDSVYYADQIVLPYKPSTVVLYAGDNDIASNYTPDQILEDFQQFVAKVHAELPQTKILYIAIKPSMKRWAKIEDLRQANKLIAQQCAKTENCEFIDIDAPMLGEDGKPRAELFKDDQLHMTEAGYEIWVEALKPHLQK